MAAGVHGQERRLSLTQYYTATTLDGFIADADNSLELAVHAERDDGRADELRRVHRRVGAIAMGRPPTSGSSTTSSQTRTPSSGSGRTTSRAGSSPTGSCRSCPARIEFTSGDVATVHAEMVAAAGGRNVWIVGGGDLAGQFADVSLLDQVIVYDRAGRAGRGRALLPRHVELRLDDLGRNGDFACARYSVVRPAA